jgi:predicted dehydrogenase
MKLNRKLRMGMIGGGRGAFIGAVHRMAARLDGEIELVAGCFPPIQRSPACPARICSSIRSASTPPIRRW